MLLHRQIAQPQGAIDDRNTLIDGGADVNAKDDIQDSAYLYAGAHGRTEILKMTLAAGAAVRRVMFQEP